MSKIREAARYFVRESDNAWLDDCYDAHEDTFFAGAKWALEEAAKVAEEWGKAYPEDVFTPLPKYGTPEQEAQDNVLVTRASAHMGRHMSAKLAAELRALAGEE